MFCNSIICFLPCSEIDWNATGAMLGGISGFIAVVVTVIIAIRQGKTNRLLSEQQKILTNNQIKVSVFERRLKIYEKFCDFYDFSENWIFNQQKDEEVNNGLKSLCHNLGYKLESAESATEDMFSNIRNGYAIRQLVDKERFVFENRQIDLINEYIENYTNELYNFCKRMGSYSTDFNRLKAIHQNLKTLKIKKLMEQELTLEDNWNK